MARTAADLLDLGRIEAGTLLLAPDVADVREIVDRAVASA